MAVFRFLRELVMFSALMGTLYVWTVIAYAFGL